MFRHEIQVTPEMVDTNRHVNNVVYVKWMQDAAVQHARVSGCTQASNEIGATWVVRTHHIDYLSPAFAGDAITVFTWVADFRRVRSLRRYKFVRASDQAVLAHAETDWVFVDIQTGRPRAIPDAVMRTLPVLSRERREAESPLT